MKIFAIDPGPTESGWVVFDVDADKVIDKGITENNELISYLRCKAQIVVDHLCVEQVALYGQHQPGDSVFDTAFWSGRFVEAWNGAFTRIKKPDISYHLVGRRGAKDPDTKAALTCRLGEKGTVKAPGGTHGISKHMWDALALAVVFTDQRKRPK